MAVKPSKEQRDDLKVERPNYEDLLKRVEATRGHIYSDSFVDVVKHGVLLEEVFEAAKKVVRHIPSSQLGNYEESLVKQVLTSKSKKKRKNYLRHLMKERQS